MTYSIVARDHQSGAVGVVVASRFFAAGAMVPYVGPDFAIASQAFVNPIWGTKGREMLAAGKSAQTVLDHMANADEGRAARQAHMIDKQGNIAAFTGDDCNDWAGHHVGDGFSVAGNILTGQEVVDACAKAFEDNLHKSFVDRLLLAMQAGEEAGGDSRGRQSAGLVVHRGEDYPWLDIRADDHEDPLKELWRLYDVAQEVYLHVADYLPDAKNFSGHADVDDQLEKRIGDEAERREKAGQKSQSKATGTVT